MVCSSISTRSSWMRLLIVLFDNGTMANLLARYSGHFNEPSRCMTCFCPCTFPSNRKGRPRCLSVEVSSSYPNTVDGPPTQLHLIWSSLSQKSRLFPNAFSMFWLNMPLKFSFFQAAVSYSETRHRAITLQM